MDVSIMPRTTILAEMPCFGKLRGGGNRAVRSENWASPTCPVPPNPVQSALHTGRDKVLEGLAFAFRADGDEGRVVHGSGNAGDVVDGHVRRALIHRAEVRLRQGHDGVTVNISRQDVILSVRVSANAH